MAVYTVVRLKVVQEYYIVDADRVELQRSIDAGDLFENLEPTSRDGELDNVKVFEGDPYGLRKTS